MATKRSASAEDPLEVHTSLEFRRGKTPGIVIRHGGGSGFRYLEFALPDQAHSVRVEWNSDDYKQARANQGVPVTLIVDGGQPRKLTYNDGALYEQGRSAPVVDKKAAVVGKRFAAVFAQRGDTVRRMQRPTGPPNPTGWLQPVRSWAKCREARLEQSPGAPQALRVVEQLLVPLVELLEQSPGARQALALVELPEQPPGPAQAVPLVQPSGVLWEELGVPA